MCIKKQLKNTIQYPQDRKRVLEELNTCVHAWCIQQNILGHLVPQ